MLLTYKENVHSTQMYIPLKPLFSRHKGIGVQFTDEPTGNLDKQSGDQIIRFMKETNRLFGQTYIIVTHNKEIADYTDREITIDDGEIINDIDLLDVRENEVIK